MRQHGAGSNQSVGTSYIMADANYRRLSCRTCNLDFAVESRAGRPPVQCFTCKSARKPAQPAHTHCEHCKTEMHTPRAGKRFCSKTCLYRHRDASAMTREQYREHCKANRKYSFTCVNCGADAYRKLSASNASKGYENKFCSMACRTDMRARVRRECEFLRGLSLRIKVARIKVANRLPAIRSLVASLSGIAKRREYAQRPCKVCGESVGYARLGMPRTYCSRECQKQSPSYVASRKATKYKRKALKRGANGGESINPIAVFASAGWKCQICSKPTPQRLRGTTHKRAPELDHIVPISKGGKHTWANTQCACRECNQWKSDRLVIGQIGLFTGLM